MRRPVAVIAVDPGGRNTGIVARNGDNLLAARVLVRKGEDSLPTADYLHEVNSEVSDQLIDLEDTFEIVIAIEGLKHPNPHLGLANVMGLIGTAMVFGAVLQEFPEAHVVPPGKNGKLPDRAYPEEIRKGVRIGGPSEHARSAWDVAAGGRLLARGRR